MTFFNHCKVVNECGNQLLYQLSKIFSFYIRLNFFTLFLIHLLNFFLSRFKFFFRIVILFAVSCERVCSSYILIGGEMIPTAVNKLFFGEEKFFTKLDLFYSSFRPLSNNINILLTFKQSKHCNIF